MSNEIFGRENIVPMGGVFCYNFYIKNSRVEIIMFTNDFFPPNIILRSQLWIITLKNCSTLNIMLLAKIYHICICEIYLHIPKNE